MTSLPTMRALMALLAGASTAPVEFMRLPLDANHRPVHLPMIRLDPVSTGSSPMAGMDDPDATAAGEWQVTCIGETAEQALWLLDKVHDRLFARDPRTGDWTYPLTATGRSEWHRERGPWALIGGDSSDGIVSLVGRFTITTSTL